MRLFFDLLRVAATLCATTLAGFVLLRPALRSLSRGEKIAWSLAAGILALAGLEAVFLIAGITPGPIAFALGLLAAAATAVGIQKKAGPGVPPRTAPAFGKTHATAARALLCIAAIAAGLYLVQAVSEPMWSNDFLAIWGFKARTIHASGRIPDRLFHDRATLWSHPEYPMTLPLSMAAISSITRRWDDQALALLFPAVEIATLCLLSGFFRRRGSPLAGAAAALLCASCFFLYRAFETGMGEIPAAFAFALTATALLDALDDASPAALVRLAVSSLFCATLKREGLVFAIVCSATLFAWSLGGAMRPRRWRVIFAQLVPAVAASFVLRLARGPLADRDVDASLWHADAVGKVVSRLGLALSSVVRGELVPLAIPLVALGLFFLVTPKGRADILIPPLLLQFLAYVAACAFFAGDPAWLEKTAFARIASALIPAAAIVIGARIASLSLFSCEMEAAVLE